MIDRDPIFDVIRTVLSEFRLDNMADENGLPYPLVDLMSNPAPDDISTGLAQMDSLAWEIGAAVLALLSAARDEGRAEGLGGEWVMVPREPTYELLRAMSESVAVDDEGPFPPLFDLLDFSGENKTYTVLRAAYAAMIAAAPPASLIKER